MITLARQSAPPPKLRADYLDHLPEPQEMFVEVLVARGTGWSIRWHDREIGYAVTDGGETLLELHVATPETGRLAEAFDALAQAAGVRRILAKSFDAALLY